MSVRVILHRAKNKLSALASGGISLTDRPSYRESCSLIEGVGENAAAIWENQGRLDDLREVSLIPGFEARCL